MFLICFARSLFFAASDKRRLTGHFNARSYYDKTAMLGAIDAIPYPEGGTKTSRGLYRVRTSTFTEDKGMRPASAGVSKVLVVITDGQSTKGYEVRTSGMPVSMQTALLACAHALVASAQNSRCRCDADERILLPKYHEFLVVMVS